MCNYFFVDFATFIFYIEKNMAKEVPVTIQGTVVETKPNIFVVKADNGHTILANLSGRIKMHFIKVVPGDKVTVEVSPYDLNRGRIVRRD